MSRSVGVDGRSVVVNGRAVDVGARAIPDTSMFESPIYQFYAGAIGASDGDSPVPFTEVLAGLTDASAVDSPIYRADKGGYAAVEYDGSNDGHQWTADSQLPTGDSEVSFAALLWVRDETGNNTAIAYGDVSDVGEHFELRVGGGKVQVGIDSVSTYDGASVPTGELITIGTSYSTSEVDIYSQGTRDNTVSESGLTLQDTDQTLASKASSANRLDGFLVEAIVSDVDEPDQAFSDYHAERLG